MKKYIIISGIMLSSLICSVLAIFYGDIENAFFSFYSWMLILIPIDIWLCVRNVYKIRYLKNSTNIVSMRNVILFWLVSLTTYCTALLMVVIVVLYNGDWRGILWNLDSFIILPVLLLPIALLIFISYKLSNAYYSQKNNLVIKPIKFLSNRPWAVLSLVFIIAIVSVFIYMIAYRFANEIIDMIVVHSIVSISVVSGKLMLEKRTKTVLFTIKYCITFTAMFILFFAIYVLFAFLLKLKGFSILLGIKIFNITNDVKWLIMLIIFLSAQVFIVATFMAIGCICESRKRKKLQG